MKDVILFCSGGFAGLALAMIIQILRELGASAFADEKAERVETDFALRDNKQVSEQIADKYYD